MKASEIREKYLKFFEARGHKRIAPAPLVLENDPSTLFTSSGMQPLVPYLMGAPHPEGKRLVDSQPSIRLQDIEEVGDNRHTTFFEMLGNWSLGDYFKKEQLAWFFEFLTKELRLDPERLYVSVFGGEENARVKKESSHQELLPDVESANLWGLLFQGVGIEAKVANTGNKKPNIKDGRIFYYGVEKNWWSRSGVPRSMPVGEIGGPDSEVFYDFGEELGLHEKSQWRDEPCHPNCDCGRFLEIGNSVFMQYKKIGEDLFEELPNKNVDFGGGLERITAAVNGDPDIFNIDFFYEGKKVLEALTKNGENYETRPTPYRVILDHLRAAVFIAAEGTVPSNKGQGYVLRRLIRRAMLHARDLGMEGDEWLSNLLHHLAQPYLRTYPEKINFDTVPHVNEVLTQEVDRFRKTIIDGLKEFDKYVVFGEVNKPETKKKILDPKTIFKLYETYGFPYELSKEEGERRGIVIPSREEFDLEMEKHKEASRTASAGMFKGGLADHSAEVTRLHTATHLLHAALRKVLGEHVSQKGSNITAERLRFDFSHPAKLTDEEISRVEGMVNEQVEKDSPVTMETKTLEAAIKEGALHFFGERYGERVNVYTIGDFSKEICGGPHVESTGEVGHVRITKQEKIGGGVMRIYATATNSKL